MLTPALAIALLWIVWVISWFVAALWSDRAVKRQPVRQELFHRLLAWAGAVLLFTAYPSRFGFDRVLWDSGAAWGWIPVILTALGFAFAWWARISLGRLWSSSVSRKQDHRIVDSGPYAVVRHPIYTGIILAVVSTAALRGTLDALLGACFMSASWYVKARLEETFLREQLGPDTYDAYARRVPMLIPFLHAG